MQKTLGDNFKGRIFVLGKADVGAYRNKRNKPYSHYEISRMGFHTLQGTESPEFLQPDVHSVWPKSTDLLLTSYLSELL
jgi:hypothetical protein